jgi:type 1 fimbria pilin
MQRLFSHICGRWASFAAIALCGAASSAAMAQSNATVSVTGRIVEASCQWGAGGADRTITLDPVNVGVLKQGQVAGLMSFNLSLTNCASGLAQATFSFAGTPDATDPLRYRNTGTAKGVAIELQSSDGTTIGANGTNSQRTVAINGNQATLALRAGYWQVAAAASGGTVASTATLTVSYN